MKEEFSRANQLIDSGSYSQAKEILEYLHEKGKEHNLHNITDRIVDRLDYLIRKMHFQTKEEEVDITVDREGAWVIEGNQSIFNLTVKVLNNSQFVITNIKILLTFIPHGLESYTDHYTINSLNPKAIENLIFIFQVKESCVGDVIKGLVSFDDPNGIQKIIHISPFKILKRE